MSVSFPGLFFFVFLSFLFPHVRSVACLCTGEWTQGDEGVRTPEARYGGSGGGETSGSDARFAAPYQRSMSEIIKETVKNT